MLLVATDELHANQFLSDGTWHAWSERYDTRQLFDPIFTVGQYTMLSMALNLLGVQIERDEQAS